MFATNVLKSARTDLLVQVGHKSCTLWVSSVLAHGKFAPPLPDGRGSVTNLARMAIQQF